MKKTKKQESFENILNFEELCILKGGQMAEAVKNYNTTTECNCEYNNSAATYNVNGCGGCSCTCV